MSEMRLRSRPALHTFMDVRRVAKITLAAVIGVWIGSPVAPNLQTGPGGRVLRRGAGSRGGARDRMPGGAHGDAEHSDTVLVSCARLRRCVVSGSWTPRRCHHRSRRYCQLKGTRHDQENLRKPPGEGPGALDVVLQAAWLQVQPAIHRSYCSLHDNCGRYLRDAAHSYKIQDVYEEGD